MKQKSRSRLGTGSKEKQNKKGKKGKVKKLSEKELKTLTGGRATVCNISFLNL